MIDLISWLCFLIGGFLLLSGAVGLLRFPDFYTRMHAAGVTDTLGAGMILFGMMFQFDGDWLVLFKLLLILTFIWTTSPASSHALAKAARHHHQEPLLGKDAQSR